MINKYIKWQFTSDYVEPNHYRKFYFPANSQLNTQLP